MNDLLTQICGYKMIQSGDFPGCLEVGTLPSDAGGAGSVSGQEAKIPYALRQKKKHTHIKHKQYYKIFNKDF